MKKYGIEKVKKRCETMNSRPLLKWVKLERSKWFGKQQWKIRDKDVDQPKLREVAKTLQGKDIDWK